MDDEAKTAGSDVRGSDDAASVMDLLAEHVPLTLLADLAVAEPRSEAILQAEGLPDEAWWEDGPADGAGPGTAGPPAPVAEDAVPTDPDATADPHPA